MPDTLAVSVILVVEDDKLVRWNTADMLEEAGFSVLQAAGADEGIELLETRTDITVIFTDIEMPGR
jgi:CheY-like chemotaxis protein